MFFNNYYEFHYFSLNKDKHNHFFNINNGITPEKTTINKKLTFSNVNTPQPLSLFDTRQSSDEIIEEIKISPFSLKNLPENLENKENFPRCWYYFISF